MPTAEPMEPDNIPAMADRLIAMAKQPRRARRGDLRTAYQEDTHREGRAQVKQRNRITRRKAAEPA